MTIDTPDRGSDDHLVVAVDGGGSKTDVIAVTTAGRVLAGARGAASNPQHVGLPGAVATIGALVEDVLARSGGRVPQRVGIYLSGLDFDREVDAFTTAIHGAAWTNGAAGPPVIGNDLFAVLRTGTSAPDAAAVVCGTGINCVGVRADGATIRYWAVGAVSGDWGGGWHLGEQAMWHAVRAEDGRGPATMLSSRIPRALGRGSLAEVIEALHFGELEESRLAALSPVVFKAATAGDPVAGSLVDRQAEEIVALAAGALRRLDLLDREVPLILGGGIARAQHPRLMARVRHWAATLAPHASVIVASEPPIVGAALLVLESIGAGRDALLGWSPRDADVSSSWGVAAHRSASAGR